MARRAIDVLGVLAQALGKAASVCGEPAPLLGGSAEMDMRGS
jgi:hypothetical protein